MQRSTDAAGVGRRTVLRRLALGGIAGLAGCSQRSGGESSPTDGAPDSGGTATTAALTSASGAFRQAQYDAENTGHRTDGGVDGDGRIRWTFQTATGGPAHHVGSPVVADGVIYVAEGGAFDGDETSGRVYAVDLATGEQRWRYDAGGTNSFGEPALADGTLLQPVSGTLVGIDAATGTQRWELDRDLDTGVTVADGTAYVLGKGYADPMTVYAVDVSTGDTRWAHELSGTSSFPRPTRPAVADGTVYVANGSLTALSAAEGSVQWSTSFDRSVATAPTVSDGTVYLGGDDNIVRAITAGDGSQQWQTTVPNGASGRGGPISASLAVTDSQAFVTNAWQLTAVSTADGSTAWTQQIRENNAPVVAGETVYVGGLDSAAAFDAGSGKTRWRVRTDNESGSPVQVAVIDGAVLFSSGGLHAVA